VKILKKYKNFYKIVSDVGHKNNQQQQKLDKFLKRSNLIYFQRAEQFSLKFIKYLKIEKISFRYAVDCYLKMCFDMMESQKFFLKYKKYPIKQAKTAYKKVYNNIKEMKSYIFGLALSQFLWPTHYAMYSFFIKNIQFQKKKSINYLEIGPGHGLFLLNALENLGEKSRFDIVDISKTSIKITKSIIKVFFKEKTKISYFKKDIFKYASKKVYDFITLGEVIEHVNKPNSLLKKIRSLLHKDGRVFISTCVDCPSIDHVYHFKSIGQVEQMIKKNGFKIMSRNILPVEEKSMKYIVANKITINYCALIKKI
jgi:2-polyprenyl-3-methyl-5-hydroxy-6-metoxy-1,4-benzoquinol methylase